MPANERRFWWCQRGHIMGEVQRVTYGAGKVRALMLYEQSVDKDNVPDELPPLRGRVIGDMDQIACTYPNCGHTRDWHIGEDAYQQMMAHFQNDV